MLTQVIEVFYDHVEDRYSLREVAINKDNIEYVRPNRRIALMESALPAGLTTAQGFTDVHFRSGHHMTIVGSGEKISTKQLLRG
tara:strand:+ start:766 stop:1017 length:252 start_codon:yes stop_codon:yes gene_type:complete